MIVTVARYRAITGDSATADATVSAKLELAREKLEDDLGRSLEHDTYTETLWPTRDGYVWPSVVPIRTRVRAPVPSLPSRMRTL